jgi:uncharacterized protein YjbI with pentapeptide repeats
MTLSELKKANTSLTELQKIYQKILVEEFIREFKFLADVVAERGTAKGDFTDKLTDLAKQGLSMALGTLPLPAAIPNLIGGALTAGANAVGGLIIDHINDERKQSKQDWVDNQNARVDEEALRIVLERVAREAARRYEYIIAIKLSEEPLNGVIPLAKVGVERMLEYVARNSLSLTEENLLKGLIEGRSGAYIKGFTNTEVSGRDKFRNLHLTAEGIYGRSAFRSQEKNAFYILTEKEAKTYWEKKNSSEKFLARMKEGIYTPPYSKFEKDAPKYGYVEVPEETIQYFGYSQAKLANWQDEINKQYQPRTKTVGIEEVSKYLAALKEGELISFIEYIHRQFPHVEFVRCIANLSDLDLRNTDWTDCDMSGSVFQRTQLQGSKFLRTDLVRADFTEANASNANFSQAHMEYALAEKTNFTGANFCHAQLSFAILREAMLSNIQHFGANWLQADVWGVQIEEPIVLKPAEKSTEEKLSDSNIHKIREGIEKLDEKFKEKSKKWDKKLKKQSQEMEQFDQELEQFIVELKQEQQMREVLERYCKNEFSQLQAKIHGLGIEGQESVLKELKLQLEGIQKTQETLPSVLSHFDDLVEKMSKRGFDFEQELKTEFDKIKVTAEEASREQVKQLSLQQKRFEELEEKLEQVLKEKLSLFEQRIESIERKQLSNAPEYTLSKKLIQLRNNILFDSSLDKELAYYVEPNCKISLDSADILPLYDAIEAQLLKSDAQVLLLKGEAGAGKSTFNRCLLRKLWQDPAWQNFEPGGLIPKAYVPIFISLGSPRITPSDLFRSLDLSEWEINFTDVEVNVLTSSYNILIIADGYDEMQNRPAINIYDANNFNIYKDRVKLLIGCRTQRAQMLETESWFMPHEKNKNIAVSSVFRSYYVADFNEKQITDYLEKYIEKNRGQSNIRMFSDIMTYQKYFNEVPDLKALLKTPFLLLITVEVLPTIIAQMEENKSQENQPLITRAKLYDRFIKDWFLRQEEKLRMTNQLPESGNIQEDYQEFCSVLAQYFYKEGITHIQYPLEEKSKSSRLNLERQPTIVAYDWRERLFGNKEPDIKRAREGSPLRTDKGNCHQFIHASLIDYFLTTAYWKRSQSQPQEQSIKQNQSSISVVPFPVSIVSPLKSEVQESLEFSLNSQLLSRDQVLLLADRLKEDKENKFKSYLWSLVEASKKEDRSEIAAANAISVLNAGGIDFNNEDLENVRIPGADLSGGVLDGVNFKGADLRKVNFRGAWLRGANFLNANMQGVDLGLLPRLNVGKTDSQNKLKFIRELNQIVHVNINNKTIDYFHAHSREKVFSKEYKNHNAGFWVSKNLNYVYVYERHTESQKSAFCIWDVNTAREIVNYTSPENISQICIISNFVVLLSILPKKIKCHYLDRDSGHVNIHEVQDDNITALIEPQQEQSFYGLLRVPLFQENDHYQSHESKCAVIEVAQNKRFSPHYYSRSSLPDSLYLHFNFEKEKVFHFYLKSFKAKFCWHQEELLFYYYDNWISDTKARGHQQRDLGVIDILVGKKLYDVTCSYQHIPHGTSITKEVPARDNLKNQELFILYGFESQKKWNDGNDGIINLSTSKVRYESDVHFLWHPTETLLVVLTKSSKQTSIFVPFHRSESISLNNQNFSETYYRTVENMIQFYSYSSSYKRNASTMEYKISIEETERNYQNYRPLDDFKDTQLSQNEIKKYKKIVQDLSGRHGISLPPENESPEKLGFLFAKHSSNPWIAFLLGNNRIFVVDLNTQVEFLQIRRKLDDGIRTNNYSYINYTEIFDWDKTGTFLIAGQESWNIDNSGALRNVDKISKLSKLEVNQHNKFIVTVSVKNDFVFVIYRETGKSIFSKQFKGRQIIDVTLQKNLLAVISTENVLRIYNVNTQEKLYHHKLNIDLKYGASIQWHPNEKEVLIRAKNSSHHIDFTSFIELETGSLKENYVKLFCGEQGNNVYISIDPQGRYLVGIQQDAKGSLRIYDLRFNKLINNLLFTPTSLRIEWNRSGSFFLAGSNLYHYDINKQQLLVYPFSGKLNWHNDLLFVDSGSLIFKIEPTVINKLAVGSAPINDSSVIVYLQTTYLGNSVKLAYYDIRNFQLKDEKELRFPFMIAGIKSSFDSNIWNVYVHSSDSLMLFECSILNDQIQHRLKWVKGILGFSLDQIRFSDNTKISELNRGLLKEYAQSETVPLRLEQQSVEILEKNVSQGGALFTPLNSDSSIVSRPFQQQAVQFLTDNENLSVPLAETTPKNNILEFREVKKGDAEENEAMQNSDERVGKAREDAVQQAQMAGQGGFIGVDYDRKKKIEHKDNDGLEQGLGKMKLNDGGDVKSN